jgi:hypothetical protein
MCVGSYQMCPKCERTLGPVVVSHCALSQNHGITLKPSIGPLCMDCAYVPPPPPVITTDDTVFRTVTGQSFYAEKIPGYDQKTKGTQR